MGRSWPSLGPAGGAGRKQQWGYFVSNSRPRSKPIASFGPTSIPTTRTSRRRSPGKFGYKISCTGRGRIRGLQLGEDGYVRSRKGQCPDSSQLPELLQPDDFFMGTLAPTSASSANDERLNDISNTNDRAAGSSSRRAPQLREAGVRSRIRPVGLQQGLRRFFCGVRNVGPTIMSAAAYQAVSPTAPHGCARPGKSRASTPVRL